MQTDAPGIGGNYESIAFTLDRAPVHGAGGVLHGADGSSRKRQEG